MTNMLIKWTNYLKSNKGNETEIIGWLDYQKYVNQLLTYKKQTWAVNVNGFNKYSAFMIDFSVYNSSSFIL